LYARPTVVNNVETIAQVPGIISGGVEWFRAMGTEASPGHGIFSLSGHVKQPGQYEAAYGITMRQLLDMAGGVRQGHSLKFFTPGGSSTPLLTAEHLDLPLDYESVVKAGSMLGTRALQVFDETVCVVRVAARWMQFYAHESCGKCTPCRQGTAWLCQLLNRIEAGLGSQSDLDLLAEVPQMIVGKAFCPLGDGAPAVVTSSLRHFFDEYAEHLRIGACPFDPAAATNFAEVTS
jgi:NADH-quinone oxidoreductase subunit F